jgi:hypothetical protein
MDRSVGFSGPLRRMASSGGLMWLRNNCCGPEVIGEQPCGGGPLCSG